MIPRLNEHSIANSINETSDSDIINKKSIQYIFQRLKHLENDAMQYHFQIPYLFIKIDNEYLQHGLVVPTIDCNQNTNPVNVRN